jgi:hypothetical protein
VESSICELDCGKETAVDLSKGVLADEMLDKECILFLVSVGDDYSH